MSKFSILERAKTKLVIADPFYGTIVLETPIVEDNAMKEIAATDGEHIYINSPLYEALPLAQAVGVLKHEAEHIARKHMFRRGNRDPEKWNTACDAIINDGLEKEGNELPKGCVNVPGATQWSEEQYYNMIPDKPKGGGGQGQGKGQGQGSLSGGQGGGGGQQPPDPLGNDVRLPPPGSNSGETEGKIDTLINRARNVAKARGLMPADLEAELEELLTPKISWKEKLQRWCTEMAEEDVSWARPDRRFITSGIYLPGKFSDDAMGEFIAVFDTSGSMSSREIEQSMGETVGAIVDVTPSKFVAVYCDAKVQHVDEFHDPNAAEVSKSFKRYGHGGTDMTEALDYIDEHYPNVAAVVVFTDGETPYGGPRKYPVMWGITHARCLDRPPWGEVVHVEFDDD